MKCSRCGFHDTKVLESRLNIDARSIRRRRACRKCDHRYTTYEKEEGFTFHVRKKNAHLEPYQRDKALRSLQIACQKRKIKPEELAFMLNQVESRIQEEGEAVIPSQRLGDLLMAGLAKLDPVAYIRFASVYKDFKDPSEFQHILHTLTIDKDL
jgi:transcriptional repressor NrdR